jgi:hypothetical protein
VISGSAVSVAGAERVLVACNRPLVSEKITITIK